MAKTVMIPASEQEMWVCRINHVEYSYPQGTEQTVPDEVAELIEAIKANEVKEEPKEKKDWAVYTQGGYVAQDELSVSGGSGSLPDTTSASAGDVLSLDSDKSPVWSAPSGGGGGNLVLKLDSASEQTVEIGGTTFTKYTITKEDSVTPVSKNDLTGKSFIVVAHADNSPDYNYLYPCSINTAGDSNVSGSTYECRIYDPYQQDLYTLAEIGGSISAYLEASI